MLWMHSLLSGISSDIPSKDFNLTYHKFRLCSVLYAVRFAMLLIIKPRFEDILAVLVEHILFSRCTNFVCHEHMIQTRQNLVGHLTSNHRISAPKPNRYTV